MESKVERIINDLKIINSFNSTPGKGNTRFSFSREDKLARQYLINEMKTLGLEISVDGVGNIRGKYNPMNSIFGSIMIGSHIDTVLNGGQFDGLTGVVCALEVVRVIKENEIQFKKPLEIIIWSEEEGSNSGITMLGSKAMLGKYTAEELKTINSLSGKSMYELMKDAKLDVDNIDNQVFNEKAVDYIIELHIEQGGILDSEGLSIGVVMAVAGMRTYKITLNGVSNHAGSTPMHLRFDPLKGASKIISYIDDVVKTYGLPTTVATTGKINCFPNVPNIIPSSVEFYLDIRDVEEIGIRKVSEELIRKTEEVSKLYGLDYDVKLLGESEAVKLSEKIINTIKNEVLARAYPYKMMNSGAVHDSALFSRLTDVGMIFIPSKDGKSHCPEESTSFEDIKLGCDILLDTCITLAK